ncbi:glycosyltransferase [Methanobrevibacter sp.]|uniref:glycosyltransferase n=1 Tax=Methanobrevibacter sp. TaxID=66852 RepID=UPI0025FA1AAA|nr:glycosyltransferase [Methanobrevibacter sp.]
MPVFNVVDTLQNAFDSILKQSIGFENLEVIFIDNKSTDESANLIKKFAWIIRMLKQYTSIKIADL